MIVECRGVLAGDTPDMASQRPIKKEIRREEGKCGQREAQILEIWWRALCSVSPAAGCMHGRCHPPLFRPSPK
jgi:hypothetical protein